MKLFIKGYYGSRAFMRSNSMMVYILYQIRTDNLDAKDRSINRYTKRTIYPIYLLNPFPVPPLPLV